MDWYVSVRDDRFAREHGGTTMKRANTAALTAMRAQTTVTTVPVLNTSGTTCAASVLDMIHLIALAYHLYPRRQTCHLEVPG